MKKNWELGDSRYFYQNEFDKACFQYNMIYGDIKNLSKRTISDNVIRDEIFNILENPKCDGY